MMNQEILAEEALYQKKRNTKSSGYLDDQFELTTDFRQIEDYHFRIEDDRQFIQLKMLQKTSVPLHTSFSTLNDASSEFNKRLGDLLSCLDSMKPSRQQSSNVQTHGFYKLGPEAYDEAKTLEAAYQHLQMNSLNSKMEGLSIDNQKIKQKLKSKTRMPEHLEMREQKEEQSKKQLVNKMKRLNIHQEDL